ncbi:MAG: hypothetical protein ACR2IV_16800 [Bryobacteraceae bacterium]
MSLDTNNTILIGFAGTITTSLLGFAGSWVSQHYKSKADTLDRQIKADEVKRELELRASQVKIDLLQAANSVKAQGDNHAQEIRERIAENTLLTKRVESKAEAAYNVGNHTNEKIISLREDLLHSQKQLDEAKDVGTEQVDRMEGTGVDTNERVRRLEGDRDITNQRIEDLENDPNTGK